MLSTATEFSEGQRCELHDLVFSTQRSIRYHNHRRRFFDRFDKTVKVLALIAGSAAFATAVSTHHAFTVGFSALVAIISAVNLVVGPGQAARIHIDLAKKFAELERRIRLSRSIDSDGLNTLIAERLLIEAEEPPVLRVLDTMCHNELCRALDYDECEFCHIGPIQGFFADFLDLWPWRIKKNGILKE